jgi:hypothetical protein
MLSPAPFKYSPCVIVLPHALLFSHARSSSVQRIATLTPTNVRQLACQQPLRHRVLPGLEKTSQAAFELGSVWALTLFPLLNQAIQFLLSRAPANQLQLRKALVRTQQQHHWPHWRPLRWEVLVAGNPQDTIHFPRSIGGSHLPLLRGIHPQAVQYFLLLLHRCHLPHLPFRRHPARRRRVTRRLFRPSSNRMHRNQSHTFLFPLLCPHPSSVLRSSRSLLPCIRTYNPTPNVYPHFYAYTAHFCSQHRTLSSPASYSLIDLLFPPLLSYLLPLSSAGMGIPPRDIVVWLKIK